MKFHSVESIYVYSVLIDQSQSIFQHNFNFFLFFSVSFIPLVLSTITRTRSTRQTQWTKNSKKIAHKKIKIGGGDTDDNKVFFFSCGGDVTQTKKMKWACREKERKRQKHLLVVGRAQLLFCFFKRKIWPSDTRTNVKYKVFF
jgi:hypothetical protein